ncbi:MAG: hypothetical protein LBT01_00160 [Spirochaetaceae bacterium]|jgi:hypothetical protein|nr:hypothetical protein [Spirochaetaceae bacterium]
MIVKLKTPQCSIAQHRSKIFALCSLLFFLLISCDQPTNDSGITVPQDFTPPPAPPLPTSAHIRITDEAGLRAIDTSSANRKGYYELANDITVSSWTPLGTASAPFAGALDGGNHTITITSGSGGLFAYTKEATIWNLKIAGAITASGGTIQVGGIAGNANWTHITGCVSSAAITVSASGHNSAAGGIVGFMRNNAMIRACSASGGVTLQSSGSSLALMLYAGGVAGYAGTGAAGDGSSGCLIIKSQFFPLSGGAVSASGGYPYSGGIVGYNYATACVAECFSGGAVTAEGENLPYAGGIAGYNSRAALITDAYSTATVNATATSKQALAGGVSGANGANGIITRCYAGGAVTATIKGDGAADAGGSLGVPTAANAGGIAGAVYYEAPALEYCAALNSSVTAADSASGGTRNAYRIAGRVDGTLTNNIAHSAMLLTGGANSDRTPNGQDGADATAQRTQSTFTALGWDFSSVWKMAGEYPVLNWQ